MSITDTVAQVAADPAVGIAVASAQTKGAILAGLQTGNSSLGGQIGAASGQLQQFNALLSTLQPSSGRNVNALA